MLLEIHSIFHLYQKESHTVKITIDFYSFEFNFFLTSSTPNVQRNCLVNARVSIKNNYIPCLAQ